MICKHCEMQILQENIKGYCSEECIERELVEREILNFIEYYTPNDKERESLGIALSDYMHEVYVCST